MQNPNSSLINELAPLYNLDYSDTNYHQHVCLVCNNSFWSSGTLLEKSKEIYERKRNLCRAFKVNIIQTGSTNPGSNILEEGFYSLTNIPFCEKCSKAIEKLEILFFHLDTIVTQIDTIINGLGNILSTSFPSTTIDLINYPVKKLIFEKWAEELQSKNYYECQSSASGIQPPLFTTSASVPPPPEAIAVPLPQNLEESNQSTSTKSTRKLSKRRYLGKSRKCPRGVSSRSNCTPDDFPLEVLEGEPKGSSMENIQGTFSETSEHILLKSFLGTSSRLGGISLVDQPNIVTTEGHLTLPDQNDHNAIADDINHDSSDVELEEIGGVSIKCKEIEITESSGQEQPGQEYNQDYLGSDEEMDEETRKRRKHWPRKNTVCPICEKTLCNYSQLIVHIRTHTGEKPFQCEICGKGFISKFSLKVHGQTHQESKEFPCPHCPRIFNKYVSRHAHIKHKHQNIPYIGRKETVSCETCGLGFSGPKSLQFHTELVHIPIQLIPCSICEKPCRQSTLKKHERTHNPNTKRGSKCLECPISERMFHKPSELRNHYAKHHPNLETPSLPKRVLEENKTVKCPIENCTYACQTRRGLRHHYGTRHVDVPFPKVERAHTNNTLRGKSKARNIASQNGGTSHERRKRGRKTKFTLEDRTCNICGKQFKLRFNLLEHMRVHTGEKPYKCTYCDRYFACKGNQQKHEQVHNVDRFKIKQFECIYCESKYALKGTLYHHIRREHWKVPRKRYKCTQCPSDTRGFEKSKLRLHISRIHSDESKKKLEERRFAQEIKQLEKQWRREDFESKRRRLKGERGKPLKCPQCPENQKGFRDSFVLNRHIRVIHTSEEKTKRYLSLKYKRIKNTTKIRRFVKKNRKNHPSSSSSESGNEFERDSVVDPLNSNIVLRRSHRLKPTRRKISYKVLPSTTGLPNLLFVPKKTLSIYLHRCDENNITSLHNKHEKVEQSTATPMKIVIKEVRSLNPKLQETIQDDDIKIFANIDSDNGGEHSVLGI